MIEETDIDSTENILYELLIYAECQQDPEILYKGGPDKLEDNFSAANYIQKWLSVLAPEPCPPTLIHRLMNLQMPWTFAIGGNGAVIAILQDNFLEIRTSRDEYGAVIGRTSVNKDPNPQWRKILWSPDCSMLALANSIGKLDFYDLIGAQMFSIPNKDFIQTNGKANFRFAVAGMAFSDVRVKNTQWSYEFLVADFQGSIKGYFISPSDGFQESHTFSLSSCYPVGISCFMYHPGHNILIFCGKSYKLSDLSTSNEGSQMGMSVWRMISGPPYYKLTLSMAEQMVYSKTNWLRLINQYKLYKASKQDLVYKMSISPNGKILAAIHVSGALSLWDLPSLRLKKFWDLQLQPNYTDINPQYCEPGMKKKADYILADPFYSHIIDINWWSDEAVIMVRRCGAVTVSSISSLKNLLGISPEWFEPSPAVTSFCDRGFLAMECEVQIKSKRRKLDETEFDDDESSEDEEPSIFAYSAQLVQKVLFFISDSDRFQPPRKKIKVMSKTYRLLCLKSTTPEELYTRKINNEEYGEALALAKTYNLDCDLVYQRQWRKMPVTVESINDYLSKITKRSWVLHECLERVPESFEAAKELLMYGLQGTDVKALVTIGKGEDHGRFILNSSSFEDLLTEDEVYSYGVNDKYDDIYEVKKTYEEKKRLELLAQINFKKLTLEQKQLCQCRLKLLMYLDRLLTYEIILGGALVADEQYDHTFFKKFRSQCGLEAAVYFACNSDWEAVAALFTYHGAETLTHRLAILSNFPETTSPIEYRSLLPLFNEHELVFYPWDEHDLRDPDWCETKYQKTTNISISEDYVEEFYEKYKDLIKFRQQNLDSSLVTEWFIHRAKEIEAKSGLVENALELIKLGIQRNIQGLEKLHDDLMTLDILIYDCMINTDICLKDYQNLTEFEKVKLMMSTISEDNFIKKVQEWLLPFLSRCEKHDPGCGKTLFRSYVLSISKTDLIYCRKILEKFRSELNVSPVFRDSHDLITLGLECVYYCESTDDLKNAKLVYDILSSLPDMLSKPSNKMLIKLQNDIENLRKHIIVAELLDKNGLPVTLSILQNISENPEEVKKILTKLTRTTSHRFPVLDEPGWMSLLGDILEMQSLLFECISDEDCYEIVLQSLLCSGKTEGIALAGKMMECNNKHRRIRENFGNYSFKLPYSKSVNLVLAASQEYFNSSANASDPCMTLARTCLNLIEDVPSSIEKELDLISSVSLLQDFHVYILPLQVRLCEDRISLVQEALLKNDKNYKKSQKLMKLAYLLRAWNENNHEREGKVLTLIGERSFQAKDYNDCLAVCKKLTNGVHKEGWLICYTLGSCDEFNNLQARCDLLSFSISYCSEELIETILKRRSELQLQVLQARVKYLVGDDDVHLPYQNADNHSNMSNELTDSKSTLWQTSEMTLQALQATTQTTKAVLTSVKSVRFWKDAVNWIQPLGLSWNEEASVTEDGNKNLCKQGISAFYDGIVENAHLNLLEANYQRYVRPDLSQSQEIAFCVLRACLLEDSLKFESSESCIENSVILDMSKIYLSEDMMLSLCILLCLKQPEEAESLFKTLPSTPIVFQFASLYYSIKLFIYIGVPSLSSDDEMDLDPSSIIQKALALGKSEKYSKSEQCHKLFNLLKRYDKMLHDFLQAEILHSIGGGVDATRFTNDDEYKKDTILGISMTLDDNVFQTAVSLAHHYELSVWDIYMTHLEYLFSENSVTSAIISERSERLKLMQKLLEQKKMFESRLNNCVFPTIHGKDHDKLSLCFSYLEMCGDKEDRLHIKPSLHKVLLAKLKAAIKNIDYKLLMSPDTSHSYLVSIINESTVHVFAKLATNIPKQNGTCYEPGNMYCIWVQKFFFEGTSSTSKIPVTKTDWIHRYESCTDMLQRLGPCDIIEFVDAVIFSERALEKMTVDCRCEVVKRAIKFSRMKCSKSKNNVLLSQDWNSTVSILTGYHRHLQRMEDETLIQMLDSYDPKVKSYCTDFDLSKSSVEKLQSLLTRIVLEGPDLQLLKNFLSCCPEDIGWEPSDAYIKAINVILAHMRDPQNNIYHSFKNVSPLHTLEVVLDEISKEKDELMIEDLAVEILNEFCQDSNVPVSIRLGILQLLEKTNCLCPEYGDLLLLYRTQAIVSSVWPDLEVSEEEIKGQFERKLLFDNLTSLSRNVTHFDSLARLLSYWPPFPCNYFEICNEPWTKLLSGLITLGNNEALNSAVNVLEKALVSPSFTKECCLEVFTSIKNHESIIYILKYALKTEYKCLHSEALKLLKEKKKVTNDDYDDELINLLLKHSFTTQIIATGLYKPVIEFLLHCQDDNILDSYKSMDTIVKELYDAGYESEAGSLLHFKYSTHTGLSTYSSALNILHKWLSAPKS